MGETDPVRAYFDAMGEGEWDRLVRSPRTLVSFELHRRLLARFVGRGDRVLEVGAGPGRFTIELAGLGATVVVSDVSAVQLDLNAAKVAEAGCWRELEALLARQPCTVLAASASNALSAGDPEPLARLAADPVAWRRFLDWEAELAQEPGALDGGTHTIVALRRS